jgi:peptidoglycan/LPS O-acetylase OafA/YrhL
MVPERGVTASYMPQLDGLRTVAFAGVVVSHFYSKESTAGQYGVELFFVISGLLITGVLVKARDGLPVGAPVALMLRNFYIRRVLRLWPIFYLTVFVTLALDVPARETAAWHLLQLSNVLFWIRGEWDPWLFMHLWTLNVEEQFYLFWPLLMFFAPRRMLAPLTLVVMAAGVVWNVAWMQAERPPALGILLPDNFLTLGMGAALFFYGSGEGLRRVLSRTGPWAVVIAVASTTPIINHMPGAVRYIHYTFVFLAYAFLVNEARFGIPGRIGTPLRWAPVVAFGKVTYAAYIYHLLVLKVVDTHIGVGGHGWKRLLVVTPVVIGCAALSWIVLERRVNSLKRHFPLSQDAGGF